MNQKRAVKRINFYKIIGVIMRITIKDSDINKYKKKNPLIMQGDISGRRNFNEGEIVDLVDTRKRFIARGYIGTQNKGNG
ncbi:MAG: hypothetical protein B6I28_04230, partial [Fusobacteriia bacterium 4572_132]